MPAVLPKAPKAYLEVWRGLLLEVPPSTSCARSRNRRSPNEIRAPSRFPRFFRGEEEPGICYLANWHAIATSTHSKRNQLARQPKRISNGLEYRPLMVRAQNAIPVENGYRFHACTPVCVPSSGLTSLWTLTLARCEFYSPGNCWQSGRYADS